MLKSLQRPIKEIIEEITKGNKINTQLKCDILKGRKPIPIRLIKEHEERMKKLYDIDYDIYVEIAVLYNYELKKAKIK